MLTSHTLKSPDVVQGTTFRNGDSVIVAKGPNEGTVGTFLNFKDADPTWADILEQNSQVGAYPVEWLQLQHSIRD